MAQPEGITPLIPRETLFGNPSRTMPRVSPDGRYLAYLAPDDRNVLQVWLRTLGAEDDRVLTHDEKRGIREFRWTYRPGTLLYMQDSDGDENFHIYAVEVETRDVRDLTPFDGARAMILSVTPDRPDQVLATINARDPRLFDVHRIGLASGTARLDTENPGDFVQWKADASLTVRCGLRMLSDGGKELLHRAGTDEPWHTIRRYGPDDEGQAVLFSKDGGTLYLLCNLDANAMRLVALDPASGSETVLAEDPQYDADSLMVHPRTRAVEAVSFYRDRLAWQALDDAVAGDLEVLAAVRDGDLDVVSRDLADENWIVAYVTDDGPTYYYRYQRQGKVASLLFSDRPELQDLPLARMQPVSYAARDGLTLPAYLTTPLGAEPKNLPAILVVHGGPWARDTWGFDPWAQWPANRGYAVLQINYRGSTGYGKAFLSAGNRQWAAKMHADLIDGVTYLVERGIADPDRVAIMGGSYGGYSALVGLTFTPEVFACGVDLVGPSSLVTLLESIPPYWEPLKAAFYHRVGDLETEREFLESRSPLKFVDRIEKPLLIGQGANDPRVKQAESDQIVEAMRAKNLSVEYVVYADEGHGFARPQNRMHFFAMAEQFLAKHVGGRAEPVGEIDGHSGQIR